MPVRPFEHDMCYWAIQIKMNCYNKQIMKQAIIKHLPAFLLAQNHQFKPKICFFFIYELHFQLHNSLSAVSFP